MQTDVVVIGAGCAGMVSALEAEATGARVILIDRGPVGIGTNSALAGGIFAGPTPQYDREDHLRDTLQAGRGLNREGLVRLFVAEASGAFTLLRSLGCKLMEHPHGFAVRPPRPEVIQGVPLVKTLAGKIRECRQMKVLTRFYVTEILRDDERVHGVQGFSSSGEEVSISAPAIILATGGAGAIYLRNDNQRNIVGQGYLLAAKAGLELWDMEFVQFYPLGMAEPGLPSLLVYPPHHREARLVNGAGEDILKKHGIEDMQRARITRRDEFSALLYRESLEGPVYMDYRAVPGSFWQTHPLGKVKFGFSGKLLRVSPVAHFFMGGVAIDEHGQTSLPGLFACGEVAWGLQCVVFGSIAGRHAAQYAGTHRVSSMASQEASRGVGGGVSSSRGMLKELRRRIREVAWRHAGVVRSERGLREGLQRLMELEGDFQSVVPETVAERRLKGDVVSAAFVLKAVLTASLARKESRGSFILEDVPQRDDDNWRKNSCLTYDRQSHGFSLRHETPM